MRFRLIGMEFSRLSTLAPHSSMNLPAAQYERQSVGRTLVAPSLLDSVLEVDSRPSELRSSTASTSRLDAFLQERDPLIAVGLWVGPIATQKPGELRRTVIQRLNADVARIDELLNAQVNAILHHNAFQKLEAAWRGLQFLAKSVPDGANVKIRVLNSSWKELVRDQERAIEFDQSQLFRKIYNDEFGTPGGEPFGLLVGNYDICHRPFPDHPTDDITALQSIAGIAAAAFAPFVCGIDPRFLEIGSFAELELPLNLSRTFEQLDYLKWRAFRDMEDARFIGLVLPRVIYRHPYQNWPGADRGFAFEEDTALPDLSGYLWGNPAFTLAACAVRSFAESNWLADIRGARPDVDSGGRVLGLPAIGYGSGSAEIPRSITDAHVTDRQETELAELGFIPLCHIPGAAEAAFYSTPSAQKPRIHDEAPATANSRLSSMLHYILCASRFAHYIKVIMRDTVGSFTTATEVEDRLSRWLMSFVTSSDDASAEQKSRYPLREGKVKVREIDGKPGAYQCSIFLRPHFQLDQLSAGIRLTTQLNSGVPTN